MQYIQQYYNEILEIIGAVVTIATIIVGLTKSEKDDQFLGKIKKILVYFSLLNEDGSAKKGK